MTATEVAQLYQRGGNLSDMAILELKETDLEAWACAVDPTHRELYLPRASKGAERGRQMLEAVVNYVSRATAPLVDKIKELDRRQESTDLLIQDLEARITALEKGR